MHIMKTKHWSPAHNGPFKRCSLKKDNENQEIKQANLKAQC